MALGVVYEDGKMMIKQIDDPSEKTEESIQEEKELEPVEEKTGFFNWIRGLIK